MPIEAILVKVPTLLPPTVLCLHSELPSSHPPTLTRLAPRQVAAAGLEPEKHLGMTIAEVAPTLFALEKKFGSHVCGEGGEYETFVTDCPLFKAKIVLEETRMCGDRSRSLLCGELSLHRSVSFSAGAPIPDCRCSAFESAQGGR